MTRRTRAGFVAAILFVFMPAGLATSQTLTELNATNAARNQMIGDSANAAAGARPTDAAPAAAAAESPAKATPSVGFGGIKYTLSYALMLMLIGLGMYLVCRPSHRHDPE